MADYREIAMIHVVAMHCFRSVLNAQFIFECCSYVRMFAAFSACFKPSQGSCALTVSSSVGVLLISRSAIFFVVIFIVLHNVFLQYFVFIVFRAVFLL